MGPVTAGHPRGGLLRAGRSRTLSRRPSHAAPATPRDDGSIAGIGTTTVTARRGFLPDLSVQPGKLRTADYLERIGVRRLPPATCPFDPGYDPLTFAGHLAQSSHLIETMKISMAGWLISSEEVSRWKVAACREAGVPTVTGGGPFEIAVQQGELAAYLDLVADVGITGVEAGEGFTDMPVPPEDVIAMASSRGLWVQFELGKKHGGAFSDDVTTALIEQGRHWVDAGARQVIIEARESAAGIGCFDEQGNFRPAVADRFAEAFGLD